MIEYEAQASLGRALFGHAQLGDTRRTERLVAAFDQLCRHPGGTLPDKLSAPADLKGLYRLCDCPTVTHAALIAAQRSYTLGRLAAHPGPVLVLHDDTELDYSTLASLVGNLGQIGRGHGRGYICHNVLAVDAETGEALGLLDQVLHCRERVPKDESVTALRERESRESRLWVTGTAHLPAAPQLIDVADQGADTFEFLEHEARSGRRFVIRVGKTRKVQAGPEASGNVQYLKPYAQSLPELGRFTMDVQPQKGFATDPSRQARKAAEFAIRGGPVLVFPPHVKHGQHGNDPLPLYVVLVSEVNPPPGEKSIEWLLLTNEPVPTFDDAWRVTTWYERRWVIEEYHKALKTGCRIEDLQFTAVQRLQPAIALLSAVALTLLNLRDASRRPDAQTRPATTMFQAAYVEALSMWRHGKLCNFTIHEFFFALARLGGHQNRKGDHRPGWLILWRGWTKLQLLVDGFVAGQRKRCG